MTLEYTTAIARCHSQQRMVRASGRQAARAIAVFLKFYRPLSFVG